MKIALILKLIPYQKSTQPHITIHTPTATTRMVPGELQMATQLVQPIQLPSETRVVHGGLIQASPGATTVGMLDTAKDKTTLGTDRVHSTRGKETTAADKALTTKEEATTTEDATLHDKVMFTDHSITILAKILEAGVEPITLAMLNVLNLI